jgi:hypothetical protein
MIGRSFLLQLNTLKEDEMAKPTKLNFFRETKVNILKK